MTTKRKRFQREGTARAKAVSEETERRPVWLGSPSQAETGVEMTQRRRGQVLQGLVAHREVRFYSQGDGFTAKLLCRRVFLQLVGLLQAPVAHASAASL